MFWLIVYKYHLLSVLYILYSINMSEQAKTAGYTEQLKKAHNPEQVKTACEKCIKVHIL